MPTSTSNSGFAPMGTILARGFGNGDRIRWPLVRAGELFELLYGRGLVEGERRTGAVPVFGTNGQCGWHDTPLFKGPGVVLGRKGQGPLGVEWVSRDYWVIDTAYSLLPIRADVNLKFAYYLIKFVGLNHLKDGTSNPSLSRDTFGAQLFPWPPPDQQRAIATILGALDDKIDLNRRMNETLEGMARALFKSWFVDLDPVRAKAEGRRPSGMDAETAKLFPTRLVETEAGALPEGWREATLNALAVLNPESWSAATRPAVIKYIDLSNTKWGQIETVTPYVADEAPSRAQRVLRAGDSIIGTVRPGNGSYALVTEAGLTGSSGFAVLRPRKTEYTAFVYLAATAQDNIDRLAQLADGGAYPAVRSELVAATPIVLAQDPVLQRFEAVVGLLNERIAHLRDESATLAALRDALLPRLLSGEISLRAAERVVG